MIINLVTYCPHSSIINTTNLVTELSKDLVHPLVERVATDHVPLRGHLVLVSP